MKAFVAVFAGIAAASAAPKADPGYLLPALVVDPHASSGETVEHPNGVVVPDKTNAVKLAEAAHYTAKALAWPHYGYAVPAYGHYYGKREAEAEPWLGYGHGVVLVDPHASTGETVEYPNGAVVPDETNSVKLQKAAHLTAKALAWPHYGYGVYGHYGKRDAEAKAHGLYGHGLYGGLYGGYYGAAVVPTVGAYDTGLVVSPASGAVTPDFTDAQKEAGLGEGTHAIKVPVVTGHHVVVGKREAEAKADPWLYGHGLYGGLYGGYYGAAVVPTVGAYDTGLVVSPASGAVTPDFTDAQKEAGLGEGTHAIKVPVVTGHHVVVGKREAEAEADPYLVAHYNGAVTPDYTYAQKVAAANHFAAKGYGLLGLGYGYHYGKRSADADAWYGYGYGYGYPAYTAGYAYYG